jgi:hypothetical protein
LLSPTATNNIAQRESLSGEEINNPTLKVSNNSTENVARLQRANILSLISQRFSLGYVVGHLR